MTAPHPQIAVRRADVSHKSESPPPSTALQCATKEKRTHQDTVTSHTRAQLKLGLEGTASALAGSGSQLARVVGECKPFLAELETQLCKDIGEATMKKRPCYLSEAVNSESYVAVAAASVVDSDLEPDEQNGSKGMVSVCTVLDFFISLRGQKPNTVKMLGSKGIVRTRVSPSRASSAWTNTCSKTCKRKISDVDSYCDTDKENYNENTDSAPAVMVTVKRICREKTGTDWQTVLDITKYGEEQRRKKFND
jgi:hypothetical protein